MSYRPWRITLTVVVDREAFDEWSANQQALEVTRQIRKNVGGVIQEIEVQRTELAERRVLGDRRKATP